VTNAPDLFLWDTTRYTDLKKLLIGGTAHTLDGQLSFSGGNNTTQFLIGGGFHKETTVFPTDLGDQKASAHFNLTHSSQEKRFSLSLTGNYVADKNELHFGDPSRFIALAPNIQLYDSAGKINWQEGGVTFGTSVGDNPLANLNTKYIGNFSNLISNLQLSYKLFSALNLRLNLGYNVVNNNEKEINPSTSIDPNTGQLPYSYFGTGNLKSWIVEPHAEYNQKLGKGKLNVLLGATAQENVSTGIFVNASNFSSNLFLNSIAGAGNVTTNNSYGQYRYNALFGRVNYNWSEKYILNLSGRRDGSSRFGPNKRFSNFGAVGAAWLFSNEKGFHKAVSFISFGKIRGSYGVTGNDQIGDYRFIDTWTASSTTYQGISTLSPSSLYNPNYEWEVNKKFEMALELGLIKDRLLFSIAYFQNRSGNQIVQYSLPVQTGFSFIGKNLEATVQNSGIEFQLTSKNFISEKFSWTTAFNLTINKNKLLSFPGLAASSYATTYVIGEPLSVKKVFQYLGVDSSGIYQFTDSNKDGKFDNTDRVTIVNTNPHFYGGFQNTFSYKGLQLSFFFEFKKQVGLNYLNTLFGYTPGTAFRNQPIIVLNRWQKTGDVTEVQKFTATFGTPAYKAGASYLGSSGAIYSEASFIRFKNLALSYSISETKLKARHLENVRVFLQAQNLFTITKYVGADPENQNMYKLPPLRTITAGIQFTFN
jgi:TonB-linked SusC/RagA family outer membrane protein